VSSNLKLSTFVISFSPSPQSSSPMFGWIQRNPIHHYMPSMLIMVIIIVCQIGIAPLIFPVVLAFPCCWRSQCSSPSSSRCDGLLYHVPHQITKSFSEHTNIRVTTAHGVPRRKSTHFCHQYTSPLCMLQFSTEPNLFTHWAWHSNIT
jgi:hypothetical protein